MASRSAAWVLGGVGLISSARCMVAMLGHLFVGGGEVTDGLGFGGSGGGVRLQRRASRKGATDGGNRNHSTRPAGTCNRLVRLCATATVPRCPVRRTPAEEVPCHGGE